MRSFFCILINMKSLYYYMLYGGIGSIAIVLWGIRVSMRLSHMYQIDSYDITISHDDISIHHYNQMTWWSNHHTTTISNQQIHITITWSASQDRSSITLQEATINSTGVIHRLDVWYNSILKPSLGQHIVTDHMLTHRERNKKTHRYKTLHNNTITIDNMDLYLKFNTSCPRYQTLRNKKTISCNIRWHIQLILPIETSTHTATLQWTLSYKRP